ncbi:MAG: hypothetical protein HQK50_19610, partial [Oligoflexia bacterium]|nr:hypothetical protein [Oligoflexia bacterium]
MFFDFAKMWNKKFELPSKIARALGLPKIVYGADYEDFYNYTVSVEKQNPLPAYEIMKRYCDLLQNKPKLFDLLEKEFQQRHKLYLEAFPHFLEGDKNLKEKALKAAEMSYRKALAIYPFFSNGRLNLGFALRELSLVEESCEIYEEGLQYDPENPLLLTNLGRSLMILMDKDVTKYRERAITVFQQGLKLLGGGDYFCLEQLEKLGVYVRIYSDPKDPSSVRFITQDDFEKAIKKSMEEAKTQVERVNIFLNIIRDNRRTLFLELWPKYGERKLFAEIAALNMWYLFEGFSLRMRAS